MGCVDEATVSIGDAETGPRSEFAAVAHRPVCGAAEGRGPNGLVLIAIFREKSVKFSRKFGSDADDRSYNVWCH